MSQNIKKVQSFSEACENALFCCVTFNLIIGIAANIGIGVAIIPVMYAAANESFVMKDVDNGMKYIIIWIFIKIGFIMINNIIIDPIRRGFNTNLELHCEKMINNEIEILSMRSVREIFDPNSGYERKMQIAKYKVIGFVSCFMNTFMNMFSFFGYAYWVFSVSYVSAMIYIIATIFVSFFITKKEKKVEENQELYTRYWNNHGNVLHEGFHDNIKKPFEGMYNATKEIEEKRSYYQKEDKKITNIINILFNLVFAFNCYFIVSNMDIIYLITYIQYCNMLHSNVSSCFMVYEQYKDSKREYDKYEEIINKLQKRNLVKQFDNKIDGIVIKMINYVYPEENNKKPFGLHISKDIIVSKKDIILVDGGSGDGKSTAFDILSGVISDEEYENNIEIICGDDREKINGFECLTSRRFYTEQNVSVPQKASIAQIISGIFDETITEKDENVIWKSLMICCCDDFVEHYKNNDLEEFGTIKSKKWIHEKKVSMSGGQKGRIILSRMMYGIIKNEPSFILLDEVDKSVQADLMVVIMNNIFDYTKSKGIITFVIAHSTEIKEYSGYTKKITLKNGKIV